MLKIILQSLKSSMVKYARAYTYITAHMQAMNKWNVRKIGLVPSLIAASVLFFTKEGWAQYSQGENRAAIKQGEVISRAMRDLRDTSHIDEIRMMVNSISTKDPSISQPEGECITMLESDKRDMALNFLNSNLKFSDEINSAEFSIKQRELIEFEMKNLDVISFRINSRNIELHKIYGTVILNGKEGASFSADDFLLSKSKNLSNLLARRGSCTDYATQGRQ